VGTITRHRIIAGSDEEEQATRILKKAMKYYITGTYKYKNDALKAAIKDLEILNNKLPSVGAFAKNMTVIEDIHKNGGRYSHPGKNTGICNVICAVYEDVYGKPVNDDKQDKQITFTNADVEEKVSVKVLIPQEDVASQCDEALEEPEEAPASCEENYNSELNAKDKKELAMYMIDQHYFFLKQLTGVI